MTTPEDTMTEYKELAARDEKYLDLGMRMGQMSDSASNIYRIAADLLIGLNAADARCKRLEEALSGMVQRFELYAGPNDMHAGNHDLVLLKLARSALQEPSP